MADITLKSNGNNKIYLGDTSNVKIAKLLDEETAERKASDEQLRASIVTKVNKETGFGLCKKETDETQGTHSVIVIQTEDGTTPVTIPAYTNDLTNNSDFIDSSKAKLLRPDTKQSVTSFPDYELKLNTIYDIGNQTTITLYLPTANIGNFIQVDFLSGSTATTVEISATSSALMSDFDFTPSPNMIYSMFFDYGVLGYDSTNSTYIYGWRFSYAEYTYTEE